MDFWEGTRLVEANQDAKVWLEDRDVLVLAKKNKQDPTQVQFPGDWLVMVSSVIGAAVCLWIYSIRSISMRISIFMSSLCLMLHHSGCDIFVPNVVHMNNNVLIHHLVKGYQKRSYIMCHHFHHHSPLLEAKEVLLRCLVAVRYSVSFK